MRIRPLTRRGRMIVSNASHNTTARSTAPTRPLKRRTLPPRLRGYVRRRLERLEVRHDLPDRARGQQATVGRHAMWLAGVDGLKDLRVRAAVPPASVPQARTHPTHSPATVATVAVHRDERPLSLHRRLPVSFEGILAGGFPSAAGRRDSACEHPALESCRGRCSLAPGAGSERNQHDYRPKIHT